MTRRNSSFNIHASWFASVMCTSRTISRTVCGCLQTNDENIFSCFTVYVMMPQKVEISYGVNRDQRVLTSLHHVHYYNCCLCAFSADGPGQMRSTTKIATNGTLKSTCSDAVECYEFAEKRHRRQRLMSTVAWLKSCNSEHTRRPRDFWPCAEMG